jgi:hypothetical protein
MRTLTLSLLLVVSLSAAAFAAQLQPIGSVIAVEGKATATGEDGKVRPLEIKTQIFMKDKVATAAASKLQIQFDDDTVISQGEKSEMVMDEYVYSPKDKNPNGMSTRLVSGAFRVMTGKITQVNPDHFKVRTKMATIGIRGCDLGFTITPAGDRVFVITLHGQEAVTVATVGEPRILGSGQTVSIAPDGGMTQHDMTPAELASLLGAVTPSGPSGGAGGAPGPGANTGGGAGNGQGNANENAGNGATEGGIPAAGAGSSTAGAGTEPFAGTEPAAGTTPAGGETAQGGAGATVPSDSGIIPAGGDATPGAVAGEAPAANGEAPAGGMSAPAGSAPTIPLIGDTVPGGTPLPEPIIPPGGFFSDPFLQPLNPSMPIFSTPNYPPGTALNLPPTSVSPPVTGGLPPLPSGPNAGVPVVTADPNSGVPVIGISPVTPAPSPSPGPTAPSGTSPTTPPPAPPPVVPPPVPQPVSTYTAMGGGVDWSWGIWATAGVYDKVDFTAKNPLSSADLAVVTRGVSRTLSGSGDAAAIINHAGSSELVQGNCNINVQVGGNANPTWDGTIGTGAAPLSDGKGDSLYFSATGSIQSDGKLTGNQTSYSMTVHGTTFDRSTISSESFNGNLVGVGGISGAVATFSFNHGGVATVNGGFGADLH